jgi:hypothetical protein
MPLLVDFWLRTFFSISPFLFSQDLCMPYCVSNFVLIFFSLALGKPIDKCVLAGNTAGGIIIQREGSSYPEPCEVDLTTL